MRKHIIILSLLVVMAFLSLSNPAEQSYLSRVSDDYKHYHLKAEIPAEVLQKVGQSNRSTYILFSTYDYRFGNVEIYYFGVASKIFYVGIKRATEKDDPVKVV